ncbi:type VI secretion system tube protein Hcp [Roseomonas sp. HF4]|uniref:type VI secretion system tube protein Hcp n=1 Tax=Roseomonas sp. HF4 TaxID=2562313 RepID=UPI001485B7DF|nr:type VI secretion system tube protein Hcp [Roseomonas sp. HF4]
MPLLMHMANIQGESKIEQGWMTAESFQWGGSRSGALQTGGTYGRSGTFAAVQLTGLFVSRLADSTSALLWNEMVAGATALLKFKWMRTSPGSEVPVPYMEAEFRNAKITRISATAGGDRPSEALEFTYSEVEFRVINIGDSLSGAQDVVSYVLPSHAQG